MNPHWFMSAVLAGVLGAANAPSWASEQPLRWINADDLRVRNGPAIDLNVKGVLQRGAQVVLKGSEPFDGFCLIEGDGQYGYVACRYLSAEPVARPRAGQGGLPVDHRWVTGTAVNLRNAPTRDAPVVARLAVNRTVKLLKDDAGAGYCEVQPLDRAGKPEGSSGYTACQFLGLEPLPAAQAAGGDDDPVRAFRRSPGWWPLEAYAQDLVKRLPDSAKVGPWPRDAQLEEMKAHLALGLNEAAPGPLSDWATMKALAAAHDPALLEGVAREQAQSGKDKDLWRREIRASQAAQRIQNALGLFGPLHDTISARDGGQRVLRLMRALELPTVQLSFFRSESEVGPPGEGAAQLAGRFGGIYRTWVSPRKPQPREDSPAFGAGLYDMFSRTVALTRPVQFVRLYRDGTLSSTPNTARVTEILWRDDDAPMCEGWTPGYAFGDENGLMRRYVDASGGGPAASIGRAAGPARLFAYHALQAPPRAIATRSEAQTITLDRNSTGFVRFTQTGFDVDGDGQLDLVVLEGTGPGPGHIDGPTESDDPWYRLLMVNIAGAWKVLGSDTFGYGCGC